jgi:hypothetical protein
VPHNPAWATEARRDLARQQPTLRFLRSFRSRIVSREWHGLQMSAAVAIRRRDRRLKRSSS